MSVLNFKWNKNVILTKTVHVIEIFQYAYIKDPSKLIHFDGYFHEIARNNTRPSASLVKRMQMNVNKKNVDECQ